MRVNLQHLGESVFGVGVTAIAVLSLVFRSFFVVEAERPDFFGSSVVLPLMGMVFFLATLAIQFNRSKRAGAAALTVYYLLVVIVLLNGPQLIAHWNEYGTYENLAEQVAIAAASGLIFLDVSAKGGRIAASAVDRLTRIAQVAFAGCAIVFGMAHFFYLDYTAQMVPAWLPPSQLFWASATGIAHIAAGIALLVHVRAKLAIILLSSMYASFTPLIHLPMLVADPSNQFLWSENAINIALTGVALIVAASLDRTGSRI